VCHVDWELWRLCSDFSLDLCLDTGSVIRIRGIGEFSRFLIQYILDKGRHFVRKVVRSTGPCFLSSWRVVFVRCSSVESKFFENL